LRQGARVSRDGPRGGQFIAKGEVRIVEGIDRRRGLGGREDPPEHCDLKGATGLAHRLADFWTLAGVAGIEFRVERMQGERSLAGNSRFYALRSSLRLRAR
jgi:hypothetical protein